MIERKAQRACDSEKCWLHRASFVSGKKRSGQKVPVGRQYPPGLGFDSALLQKARIFLDQIVAVAMADDEIKITLLQEMVLDAG